MVRGFGSVLIILSFLAISYSPQLSTPKALAQDAVVVVGGNGTWQQTVTAGASIASEAFDGITSAAANSLALKEWTLDGIAWALTNLIIQQMSRSIITWINSGFEGSPAFVTDLNGFLLDVADVQAGNFLTELGLGFMCSPFKLDVQFALALQYQQAREYEDQCRLTDVVDNIDNFLAGDFPSGGWQGWFALTTQPGNNPYGALLLAQHELNVSITNAQGEQIKLLDFGRGFHSGELCEVFGLEENCWINNPGAVIENQLNNTLDSGRQRLIVADEINEILGALFAQLVQQVFTGAGGLLGLTTSGYSSNGFSYLEAATSVNQEQVGLRDDSLNAIEDAIRVEIRYIELQDSIISMIDSAEAFLANSCAANSLGMPGSLVNRRNTAYDESIRAENLINTLTSLNNQYSNALDPNEQHDIYLAFLDLQSSGLLHTPVQVATIEFIDIRSIQQSVNDFENSITNFCRNQNGNGGGGGGGDGGPGGP